MANEAVKPNLRPTNKLHGTFLSLLCLISVNWIGARIRGLFFRPQTKLKWRLGQVWPKKLPEIWTVIYLCQALRLMLTLRQAPALGSFPYSLFIFPSTLVHFRPIVSLAMVYSRFFRSEHQSKKLKLNLSSNFFYPGWEGTISLDHSIAPNHQFPKRMAEQQVILVSQLDLNQGPYSVDCPLLLL